jgi:hypothetical protein
MRSLALASGLALLLFGLSAARASEETTPGELVAYLSQRIGAPGVELSGRSPETLVECGFSFMSEGGAARAFFFYPVGSAKDVRGVFQVKADTRVRAFDPKNGIVEVTNRYVETENGKSRNVKRRERIEIELDARGAVRSVNVGWNQEGNRPWMYRCSF